MGYMDDNSTANGDSTVGGGSVTLNSTVYLPGCCKNAAGKQLMIKGGSL